MSNIGNIGTFDPDAAFRASRAREHAGAPVHRRLYRSGGKRAFDIVFTLLAALLVLPVIAILAVLVMRDGGAPFFGHVRTGRDGKPFRCWKIRTMVPDAKERLEAHLRENPAARREWDESFKLADDPRITRIGGILRATSLDELPQIWNILKGEMSVVGPRPVTEQELEFYRGSRRHYLALRPGLTGLWQVSGRNSVSYIDRVILDVAYARAYNLRLDVFIILATILAVLKRTGQ